MGYTYTMLEHTFFERNADEVARDLIGRTLVRVRGDREERFTICETEAYVGPEDLACHASKGRTKRTEVMYGPPGTMYVYLIYGMYWMFNIVVREEGFPGAVLIRGAGQYDGPGKLTRALDIVNIMNGETLGRGSGIWIEEGREIPDEDVLITPRIGVDYAGEWKDKMLRFVLRDME